MKRACLLAMAVLLGACSNVCKNEKGCKEGKDCECWCSKKWAYRKKEASDRPVFKMEGEDAHGKSCYCNPSDYRKYKENYEKRMNKQKSMSEAKE